MPSKFLISSQISFSDCWSFGWNFIWTARDKDKHGEVSTQTNSQKTNAYSSHVHHYPSDHLVRFTDFLDKHHGSTVITAATAVFSDYCLHNPCLLTCLKNFHCPYFIVLYSDTQQIVKSFSQTRFLLLLISCSICPSLTNKSNTSRASKRNSLSQWKTISAVHPIG